MDAFLLPTAALPRPSLPVLMAGTCASRTRQSAGSGWRAAVRGGLARHHAAPAGVDAVSTWRTGAGVEVAATQGHGRMPAVGNAEGEGTPFTVALPDA